MTISEEIDIAITGIYKAINTGDAKADPVMRSAAISAVKLFVIMIKDINRIANAVEKIASQ